jgi:hypothetical protein
VNDEEDFDLAAITKERGQGYRTRKDMSGTTTNNINDVMAVKLKDARAIYAANEVTQSFRSATSLLLKH